MARKIDLKNFKKIKFTNLVTPIKYLANISKALGVDIYIKRDDLNEIGLGGNKTRKLEYLLGDAKAKKSTHILTLGATQSNHARLTATCATMSGFTCELFLKKSVDIDSYSYNNNGNILLEHILDTTIHRIDDDDHVSEHIDKRKDQLKKEGLSPYYIPVGGSNALGSLGYFDCYFEIQQQEKHLKTIFTHLCTATGSGGTHAGLITANKCVESPKQIIGYNVQPEENQLKLHTQNISNDLLQMIGCNELCIDKPEIVIKSAYAGCDYGIPEPIHFETIKFLAKHEGVFLDPVYTSKAFTGLLLDIDKGLFKKGDKILFIHTGGTPGIFAYNESFI